MLSLRCGPSIRTFAATAKSGDSRTHSVRTFLPFLNYKSTAAFDFRGTRCPSHRVDTLHITVEALAMRERIINEIKRLADKNGGKAPGKAQFQRETGIAENDWYGKLWLRWNDAVADAGLEPNKKQGRLSSDLVLDKYAEVCRHYGKPPSSAELRFYARETPGFISHNTFTKHFGSKDGVIAALRDRAIERGEDDLIAFLPEVITPQVSNDDATSAKKPDGWVYLLQSGNHFKIGRSDELEKRVKQISIALPEKVELVHAIKTDDPPGIEVYWHRRFADQRANGEWFKLSRADVRAFKRRKFQ
jgi:hypothetical protein